MFSALLAYLLLGAVAGLFAGLLGIGGGLIIVPSLAYLFLWQDFPAAIIMHLALGTSLATIVLTSLSSIRSHHRHGAILWPAAWQLTPGLLLGASSGAVIADMIDSRWLQYLLGLFMVTVALQMLFRFNPQARVQQPSRMIMAAGGLGIGLLSALFGIGGGTLTTPFLIRHHVSLRQAIATSALAGFPIAVAGSISYLLTGLDKNYPLSHTLGYIYLPAFFAITITSVFFAPLGARLTHRLPVRFLQRLFAILLITVAIELLTR